MLNRPSVIELESTEFDSFLGEKARARRKARREGRLSQGGNLYSAVDPSVDPLLAGSIPQDSGNKPNKPMPRFKDKESMLAWLKVNNPEKYAIEMQKQGGSDSTLKNDTTEDDTTQEDTTSGGINKTYLIVGVLALAGIIYYVTKKKK